MYTATVMRDLLASVADIVDDREKEHEREHLRTLWMLADFVPICFVSIDLEGPFVSTIFFSFCHSPSFMFWNVPDRREYPLAQPPLAQSLGFLVGD